MRLRVLLASCVVGVLLAAPAGAVVCQKKKSGTLRVRPTECKRVEIPFAGALGPQGPQGPPGVDGALRVYGDGSAGARTVSDDIELDDPTAQHTDLTIAVGGTLVVQSGTVIRCTGTFTNNGTLLVQTGAQGARCLQNAAPSTPSHRPADRGMALGAAMNGELGDNTALRFGGPGGEPLNEQQARATLEPGVHAGGGGGCGSTYGGEGGPGGGSVTVLAATAIVNNGVINVTPRTAPYYGGGGGGAGGALILASRGSVTNNGTLRADGAAGGDAFAGGGATQAGSGAGGGGGGGIVHLLAPVIQAAGVVSVAGGIPGPPGGTGFLTTVLRFGGGGGGASGGRGGRGGNVTGNDAEAALAGEPGLSLESVVDPTSLF